MLRRTPIGGQCGVDTVAIERVRDSFYDMRFRENNSTLMEYDIKNYYCSTLEDYFDDDGVSGFAAIFKAFSNALESLSTNRSSTEHKQPWHCCRTFLLH